MNPDSEYDLMKAEERAWAREDAEKAKIATDRPLSRDNLEVLGKAIREGAPQLSDMDRLLEQAKEAVKSVPMDHADIPINPNIRFTVEFLQKAGFTTIDSGDGKTHACGCDREYAYVTMMVRSHSMLAEADRLLEVLKANGLDILEMTGDEAPSPRIQASYDPVDGSAIIDLMYIDDDHFRLLGLCK